MRSTDLPAEADLLKRVTVRLIDPHKREEFDRRLEAHHYLGRCALHGPSLYYVAELVGQYVALLAFGVAALHTKARDRWIGWSPSQRARRIGLVANNSRFLVLPEREKLPNLASRVLGLVLRRLSDDWLKLHGKPILAVETFINETRYRDTCYKACGREISQLIRDHWWAIENGVHYRRDVSFQEDPCRVKDRVGAEILAVMRNLAVELYELELERGRTEADSLRNWMKGQTFSNAHRMLRR